MPPPFAPSASPFPKGGNYQPVYLPAPPSTEWPIPNLVLVCEDLSHPGALLFFEEVRAATALRNAVIAVLKRLYTLATAPRSVQQIKVVLRSLDGVAYTTGSATHKEIHFSLDHIARSKDRAGEEARGVLVHEMVHCFQRNGAGQAPSGLIEGVADWVRMRESLSPPHWARKPREKWDVGYEGTAYFLEWMEGRWGDGTIPELNERLNAPYDEHVFKDLTGHHVASLWRMYCEHCEKTPMA